MTDNQRKIKTELILGDCLKEMSKLPDKSIDMILCDLPYGETARNKWDIVLPFAPLWKEYERIVKNNAAIILFANGFFTAELMQSKKELWRYNLIWEKTQPTGFLNAKKMPLRNHEDICVFYKNLPVYNPQKTCDHTRKVSKRGPCGSMNYGIDRSNEYDSTERYPKSVLHFSKDIQKSALHPTQKPVALLEWLIKTYTNEGETVLDSCMGSGSTGIACVNTGRNFIGIEIDKEYFGVASRRISQENVPADFV